MLQRFIILTVLFLATGSGIFAQGERAEEVIKVETTLVSVPVIVTDRQGRFVPNLKAADFTLSADGKEQQIEFFATVEEPLNIALLIDTSRSTSGVLDDIKDSALDFLKLLKPQDKAMIVSFDYAPHVLSALTADREQLKRAVKKADIGEYFGTALRDAIDDTNRAFANVKGRKAIILLTDGKDAGSSISADDLLYTLEESDAPVYTVFFKTGAFFGGGMRRGGGIFGGRFPNGGGGRRGGRGGSPRQRERIEQQNEDAQEFLQQLSDETAGRSFSGAVGDLKKTFAEIVEELRYQYRLGFYPLENQSGETLHTLKVKVARPDSIVRARRSYRVQRQSEQPKN